MILNLRLIAQKKLFDVNKKIRKKSYYYDTHVFDIVTPFLLHTHTSSPTNVMILRKEKRRLGEICEKFISIKIHFFRK